MKAVAAPERTSPPPSPAARFWEATLGLTHTRRVGLGRGLGGRAPCSPQGWPSDLPGRLNLLGLGGVRRRTL